MSVSLRPLGANLLLRLEPEPEASSILRVIRPEGLARFGTVTAIGPEVRDVAVGQRVLASLTAGTELDKGVVMVGEHAVLALCPR